MRFICSLRTALALTVVMSACRESPIAVNTGGPARLSVAIGPSNASLGVCGTYQLMLSVTQMVNQASVTPDSVRWTSSDTTVLSVSHSGAARALKSSPALIPDTVHATVWSGDHSGTGLQTFIVDDSRPLIGPCPGDGVTSCYAPPCNWSN